jgi:cell wall-associated NlpC family hydrolase
MVKNAQNRHFEHIQGGLLPWFWYFAPMLSLRKARLWRNFAAIVIALALSVSTVPDVVASPPRVDLKEVEEKVRDLEFEANAAGEQWNEAREKLSKVKTRISMLTNNSKRASSKFKRLQKDFSKLIVGLYQQGTIDLELQALFSSNPKNYMAQLSAVDFVGSRQIIAMRDLERASISLKNTKTLLKAEQLKSSQLVKEADRHLKMAQSKLAEARRLLNSLKAEQRKKYLARIKAKQKAQAAKAKKLRKRAGNLAANRRVKIAIRFALSMIGHRYVFGAAGPTVFDCSGLTMAAYRKAGVYLPHYSRAQISATRPVSRANLRVGDLVFFFKYGIRHVGIYIGSNRFVHAQNSRTGVIISSLSERYYASHLSGFGRVVG